MIKYTGLSFVMILIKKWFTLTNNNLKKLHIIPLVLILRNYLINYNKLEINISMKAIYK